mmetsp:Transcript_34498/g.80824  ORF Transcript_34498/g.80824 Transcript_34498/m.80824 type:complete len:165 (-) Transcript_34498:224-718(-)
MLAFCAILAHSAAGQAPKRQILFAPSIGEESFPKVKVSYWRDKAGQTCDDADDPPQWEFVWNLNEECVSFIASNNWATGYYDSVSAPRFDGIWLNYTHRPQDEECTGDASPAVLAKYAAVAPACVQQHEGKTYYLRITCIQYSASDPECTTEDFQVYVDRASIG